MVNNDNTSVQQARDELSELIKTEKGDVDILRLFIDIIDLLNDHNVDNELARFVVAFYKNNQDISLNKLLLATYESSSKRWADVARDTGISKQSISHFVNGKSVLKTSSWENIMKVLLQKD